MAKAQPHHRPHRQPRSHYIDNFRLFLTILVIYHHTSLPYGGSGNNAAAYRSSHHSEGSSSLLVAFNGINQSFFMAGFFFLSGHYSSMSARRKKSGKGFLRDKIVRLALPTLVYTLVAEPVQTATVRLVRDEGVGWGVVMGHWRKVRGVKGPVWSPGLLLVFDAVYVSLRAAAMRTRRSLGAEAKAAAAAAATASSLGSAKVCGGIAMLICADFLVRLRYPFGFVWAPLNIKPGYTPQYIAAYAFGISTPPSEARISKPLASVLLVASLTTALTGILLFRQSVSHDPLDSVRGGLNPIAACYTIWNEITGFLIGTSLLGVFRKHFNQDCRAVSRNSYAIFLVHFPVSVAIETMADGWRASGVVKTVVIGTFNAVGSVVGGWLLVKVPGVGTVIQ